MFGVSSLETWIGSNVSLSSWKERKNCPLFCVGLPKSSIHPPPARLPRIARKI
jgi:hypothetical protein